MPTVTWAIFVLGGILLGLVALRAMFHKEEPKHLRRAGSRPARTANWEQVDSQRSNAR
jgi:hypothetical protein